MSARLRCIVCLCGALAAAPALPADLTRADIAAERAAAAATLADREQACQVRFAVTACVDAARNEHRATLTRLHSQDLQLDEAKRREAAAARRRTVDDRAAAAQAKASDAVAAPRRERDVPVRQPPPRQSLPSQGLSLAPGNAARGADRRAIEQRNEEKFAARARAVREHREAVERRNAERAAQGKVAPPLPPPHTASAP